MKDVHVPQSTIPSRTGCYHRSNVFCRASAVKHWHSALSAPKAWLVGAELKTTDNTTSLTCLRSKPNRVLRDQFGGAYF